MTHLALDNDISSKYLIEHENHIKKLNEIGIFTYQQISNLNNNDIAKITELLKFFPGRIERDDWIGQAFQLLNNHQNQN